ncbi:HlyD family efflux transporter periplasmic adaptor subunit [bacterium]|nr:HlyD family efflux transporter periplasmic adaptor subunit [bacterium]
MLDHAPLLTCLFMAMGITVGCNRPTGGASSKSPEPAHVDQRLKEVELNRIVLTPLAEERLRLKSASVLEKKLPKSRQYGGEVVLPPDGSLIVSAPFAGRLEPASKGVQPTLGLSYQKGDIVFTLIPVLSPERDVLTPSEQTALAQAKMQVSQAKIDADGQVKQAQAQLDAADIALRRAEDLLRDQAGTAKAVDDARALHELAMKTLEAAAERKNAVADIKLDGVGGKVTSFPIVAPKTGQIRNLFAVADEVVPAGSPLFDMTDFQHVWIRVPIYAGETGDLVNDTDGAVTLLSDKMGSHPREAKRVQTPPTATPQTAAVDFYFKLDNQDGSLRPGERVLVRLPLRESENGRVIPRASIIYDIYGGTWVYVQIAPHTFARQRVRVSHYVGDEALIDEGPAASSLVVTDGAAELFGTEFEFGK